jgi:hypothetical protein
MWLFFFLLFPKKSIVPNLDSLLTNSVGLSDNFLVVPDFSFYHIVNFVILLSISYKVFYTLYIKFNYLSKRLFLIFSTFFCTSIFATLYYNIFLSKYLSVNYLSVDYLTQFHHLLQIFEGLIFSIVIFLGVKKKEDYYSIFKLFLLTLLITSTEFFLVSYTDLLPDFIKYFSLNYRGAFRSFIHSGSLPTGLMLFYGFLGVLGLFKKNKYLLFLLPVIALPIFYTYERSTMLLVIISSATFLFFKFLPYLSLNRIMTVLVVLFFTANILSRSDFSEVKNFVNKNLNYNVVDGSVIKAKGWFTFSSAADRKGARKRAIDVFYFSPFFGSGPGNLKIMMASSMVPMKANLFLMGDKEYQFYTDVATAYHPTDPHNFYIRLIAEYGIFGLIFLLAFLYLIVLSISNTNKVRNINIIGHCGIYSIIGYGFFQTFPISYPMIILFLTMITFNNQSIE